MPKNVLLEEMRGLSTYVAPEMLLRRQLRLAEALPQTLAATIGASVAEVLGPVRDELAAMSARIGRSSGKCGGGRGAAFGSLMQDGIGRHLELFRRPPRRRAAALDALPEKFREAEAGFGSQIGRGAEEMTASVARMVAAIEQKSGRAGGDPRQFRPQTRRHSRHCRNHGRAIGAGHERDLAENPRRRRRERGAGPPCRRGKPLRAGRRNVGRFGLRRGFADAGRPDLRRADGPRRAKNSPPRRKPPPPACRRPSMASLLP